MLDGNVENWKLRAKINLVMRSEASCSFLPGDRQSGTKFLKIIESLETPRLIIARSIKSEPKLRQSRAVETHAMQINCELLSNLFSQIIYNLKLLISLVRSDVSIDRRMNNWFRWFIFFGVFDTVSGPVEALPDGCV